MSGSHLSKEFFELIKAIGECRSKQEEDRLMTTESVLLRQRMGEMPQKRPRELVVRLLYLELLGHETASSLFIHAVTLANGKNLLDKRAGYLACSLLLKPDHELMLLLINTLLKDLQSANYLEVSAALITATRLMNADMVPILQPKVAPLLAHAQEAVRRQALMAWLRCAQLGASGPDYQKNLRKALSDGDPSVMHAGLCMMEALGDEQLRGTSRDLLPVLISILKSVQSHKLPKDFEYHRFPAPWTQTLVLRLMGRLVQSDAALSAQCYEVLTETLRKAEAGVNVGQAVIYQCIETISMMHPDRTLLELAVNYIHKFLANNSHNNLRHAGVKLLGLLVGIDPGLAMELQVAVVECLEDADDTLRTETLDLLFNMANANNAGIIVDKLLNFLRTAPPDDNHVKLELINKIFQLNEQFAASADDFAEVLVTLLKLAGPLLPNKLFARIVTVVGEEAPIRGVLLARLEKEAVDSDDPALVALALAVFGHHHPRPDALSTDLYMNAENLAVADSAVARYLFELKLKVRGNGVLDDYADSANSELRVRANELKIFGNTSEVPEYVDIDHVAAVLDQWAQLQPARVAPVAYPVERDNGPSQRLRFEAYEKPQVPAHVAASRLPPGAPSFAGSPASGSSAAVSAVTPSATPPALGASPAVQVAKRWGPQGFKSAAPQVQAASPPAAPPALPVVFAAPEEPRQLSSTSSASVASRATWQPRKTRAEIEEEERRKAEEEEKKQRARQLFLGEKSSFVAHAQVSRRWRDEEEEEESPKVKPKPVPQRFTRPVLEPQIAEVSSQSVSTPAVVDLLDLDGSPKHNADLLIRSDERLAAPEPPQSPRDLLDEMLGGPVAAESAELPAESLLQTQLLLGEERQKAVDSVRRRTLLDPLMLDVETVGSLWSSLPAEVTGEVAVATLDTFEDMLRSFQEQVGLHLVDVINDEAILAGREPISESKVFVHAAWKPQTIAVLVVSSSHSVSQQVVQRLERL